ncbi:MAG TPA: LPS-assembly protein LptD [Steroidobacteraceae bacterium]
MKPSARTAPNCRRLLVFLAIALLAGCLAPAHAQDELCRNPAAQDPRLEELAQLDPTDTKIDIESDAGELDRDGDAILRGNVRIRMGQRLLAADEAEIDAEERSVRMRGQVEYLDPRLHVRGDGGSFAGEGTAEFKGAEFELLDRNVRGAAGDVRMRGQGVIELADVKYTACPPGNEDWELSAGEISLNQQTRIGTGRDVRLDFKGVPILYTPWISFPVGDQRKSGVLFPTIGNSGKTGTMLAVPWYWNIAPNRDATLFTRYYSSRGLRLDPEFRYLTDSSRGILYGEYLFDDRERGGSRSFVELRHATRFRPRTRLHIDAANVSDSNYFEDFGSGFEGTSVTFLNRSAELRHDTRHWSLVGRAQDYQVIDDLLPDVDEPYTLAPQLGALGRWRDLPGGLSVALRAEASNYLRDLGPQGLRLDVEPSLGWRVDRHGTYLAADAALRHTSYSLSDVAAGLDDSPTRSAPILSLDTGLVLERAVGSHRQRLQTIEPRLLYLYVPFREQDDLPVFDTALPDLNLVQLFRTNRYVGADRVSDANQVAVGLTTRLLDSAGGRQYLSATLGQAFYFDDPRVRLPDEPVSSRASSDVVGELELSAYQDWSARVGVQWDPENTHIAKSDFSLQYRPASDRVINAGYRLQRDSIEQFDVSAAWPISREWRGFGRWVYSMRESKTLDQFIGLEYGSCCWALRLITRRYVGSRTGDTDTSIGLQLELKGLSSVGVDNEAFLRGTIRGYSALPPEPET